MPSYVLFNGQLHCIPDAELYHHGVKGMKWGHRKLQKWANKQVRFKNEADKWKAKADEVKTKGRLKKSKKYMEKANSNRTKSEKYGRKIQRAKKIVQKITSSKTRIKDVGSATFAYGRDMVSKQLGKVRSATDEYIKNAPKRN